MSIRQSGCRRAVASLLLSAILLAGLTPSAGAQGSAAMPGPGGTPQAASARAILAAAEAGGGNSVPGGSGASTAAATHGVQPAAPDFPPAYSLYHNYPEMVAHIRAVAAAHPAIVKLYDIGKSYQKRTIWAAKVSDHVAVDENEPEVLFDGLTHAREHLSAEMTIYILDLLASNYGRTTAVGRRVTSLVNTREIWIVFEVNPDGGQYDLTGNPFRSWRKNRQPTPGSTQVGTDINRNYGYDWGCCGGSSSNRAADTYRGPTAWSTPEARVIRDFVKSRIINGRQQIRANITFHTAGEQILWPYGHTTDKVPPDMTNLDHNTFVAMGRAMAATNGYTPMQSSRLYVTDGDEIDWLYGAQRIFSFTFEMYPSAAQNSGRSRDYPPELAIGPQTSRNRDAVLYLVGMAGCPYAALGATAKAAYCGPFFDDMEMARDWTVNPAGTDTATDGTWARGVPAAGLFQPGTATSGQAVLATGLAAGRDVDGGTTTVRSPIIHLPAGASTLHLRYWVGLGADATTADGFRVRLVGADGTALATALSVHGDGYDAHPNVADAELPDLRRARRRRRRDRTRGDRWGACTRRSKRASTTCG